MNGVREYAIDRVLKGIGISETRRKEGSTYGKEVSDFHIIYIQRSENSTSQSS